MTIVNPLASSHLVVQATVPTGRPEERQNELRAEQVVRATVVEGGLDHAVLDLNQQRFRIQTDQELQTGQQLQLQVLSTHPRLTFKLLATPIESRLAALFPLLAKSFDWQGLLSQLQNMPTSQPKEMKQVLKQLSNLLADKTGLSTKDLAAMGGALERLKNSSVLFWGGGGPELKEALEQLLSGLGQRPETAELPRQLAAVAQQIRQNPELMREVTGGGLEKLANFLTKIEQAPYPLRPELAQQLVTELKNLATSNPAQFARVQGGTDLDLTRLLSPVTPGAVVGGGEVLATPALLGQIDNLVIRLQESLAQQPRQNTELPLDVTARGLEKLGEISLKIEQMPQPLRPEQVQLLAVELKTLLDNNPAQFVRLPRALSRDLAQLVSPAAGEIAAGGAAAGGAAAAGAAAGEGKDLAVQVQLGQLKSLIIRVQESIAERPNWPADLRFQVEKVLEVMTPLQARPEILTQPEQIGLLSQLFGLNLEAELLRGKTRAALSSLKLALLGEPENKGLKGGEALHRLELFQLCQVRLAEQNQTFVPLPLPFLEEGFLLAEEDGKSDKESESTGGSTRMSLYLRMSALGNLRVDMLIEPAGMLLRVACEDQARADFLRAMGDQLKDQLKTASVQGISFTVGAESPARELLKKILPSAKGMLDARV